MTKLLLQEATDPVDLMSGLWVVELHFPTQGGGVGLGCKAWGLAAFGALR